MDFKTSGTISKKEILIKHYNKSRGGVDRELIVLSPNKNSGSDCYFFLWQEHPLKVMEFLFLK
ncbi:MAG: hypothetical protein PHY36_00515 [Methanocellales archaeon]|nr:hypothetical protein [Methanocellales archaeon]